MRKKTKYTEAVVYCHHSHSCIASVGHFPGAFGDPNGCSLGSECEREHPSRSVRSQDSSLTTMRAETICELLALLL
jgi:hypothetical protein